MRRADIEVPNLAVAVDAWARLACYPRGNFYLLISHLSTKDGRFTKFYFRNSNITPFENLCDISARRFLAARHIRLAVKLAYAFALSSEFPYRISQPYKHLRYSLGGERPTQTTHQALSLVGLVRG